MQTVEDISVKFKVSRFKCLSKIREGQIKATRIGRFYVITDSPANLAKAFALDSPTEELPPRNPDCLQYGECLSRAAREDKLFSCKMCKKFVKRPEPYTFLPKTI